MIHDVSAAPEFLKTALILGKDPSPHLFGQRLTDETSVTTNQY